MLDIGRPGLLFAGILLSVAPLLLHLLTRRPPERAPLPTARFLRPDRRTSVRIERRPTDVALLIVRMLFVLLLSLALAAPTWAPRRAGTHTVVMLDAGRGMADVWPGAIDDATGALAAAGARAELIVFDTTARVLDATPARLDSLRAAGPAAIESRYAAAFDALRRTPARAVAAESARAQLITIPRLGAWSPGFALLRRASWPGAVTLIVPLPGAPGAHSSTAAPTPRAARVIAEEATFVAAALSVLDYDVPRDVGHADALNAADVVFALDGAAARAEVAALLARARAGATVVWAGAPPPQPLADAPPFAGARQGDTDALPVLFDDGTLLRHATGAALEANGSGPEADERARARPRVVAVRADGRAAVLAATAGGGCLVYVGFALDVRETALADGFPDTVRRLANGCAAPTADGDTEAGALRLDAAARAALAGDGPQSVALGQLADGRRTGRDVGRPLLALVLAVALVETMLVYGRRRRDTRRKPARGRAAEAALAAGSVGAGP